MSPAPKTAAELRARIDECQPYAKAIIETMLRGDHDACAAAQKAMREKKFGGK